MSKEDYRNSHQGKGSSAEGYDKNLFSEGQFDRVVWEREKLQILEFVEKYAKDRSSYLDFACGTGRVLALLEESFEKSTGVDISEDMLEVARRKIKKSKIVHADITEDVSVVEKRYGLITHFRFILNAQNELREQVLKLLATLMDEDSVMIFNIHGNKYSSRWPMVLINKFILKIDQNQLTHAEVAKLINDAGLEVIERKGVVWFDKSFYNILPKFLWGILDSMLSLIDIGKNYAVYDIYVCKKS